MEFAIGIIIGMAIAILIIAVLIFFRRPVEQTVQQIQTRIEMAGPRAKGFVIDPIDEADESREDIIEKNKKDGRDTPVSDLY